MNRQQHWNHVYQTKDTQDVSWHQRQPDLSLALIAACGVNKDAGIIDVGGGESRLVDCLLDDGFRRLAVLDVSAVALAHTRARLGARAGSVEWFEADVTSFEPPHRLTGQKHDRLPEVARSPIPGAREMSVSVCEAVGPATRPASPGQSRPQNSILDRNRSAADMKNTMDPTLPSRKSRRLPALHMLLVSCLFVPLSEHIRAADAWTDISSSLTQRLTNSGVNVAWPGGCSGVVVNRLNGDVTIKVVGCGFWRSRNQGKTWAQVDDNIISGRDETGWATQVDQNNPVRMASFSLDGSAGWTTDGLTWRRFTDLGRNWDYGSVDWAAEVPRTIIAAKHETDPPGEVYATMDGGRGWKQLAIHLNADRGQVSMVGTLDASTFIYSKGDGIHRSTDAGVTWVKVSAANPQTRIPVLFKDVHYLGTANGLIVSGDKSASWRTQGAAVDIWQGPFFGRDEKEMMVVGKNGFFYSNDAGKTWTHVADLKPKEGGFVFEPNWFGCFAWDPVRNILYASAMGNPVYKLEL